MTITYVERGIIEKYELTKEAETSNDYDLDMLSRWLLYIFIDMHHNSISVSS